MMAAKGALRMLTRAGAALLALNLRDHGDAMVSAPRGQGRGRAAEQLVVHSVADAWRRPPLTAWAAAC